MDSTAFWTLHAAALITYKQNMRKTLVFLAVVTIAAIIYMYLCPTTGSMNMAMAAGYHLAH